MISMVTRQRANFFKVLHAAKTNSTLHRLRITGPSLGWTSPIQELEGDGDGVRGAGEAGRDAAGGEYDIAYDISHEGNCERDGD